MWVKLGLGVLTLYGIYVCTLGQGLEQECRNTANDGCRLSRVGSYFVAAPKKIRPDMVVQISVAITKMYYKQINVRAAIRKDRNEEIVAASRLFEQEGHSILQLYVPERAQPGEYTLRVEGTEAELGVAGYLFENETDLIFETKSKAVFIQLNKPFYRQGQKVLIRIMPVETNLMSKSGSLHVYIYDPTGTVVRRWLSQQTNAGGVLDTEFQLSEQPHYGEWKVVVEAFGAHRYEKPFEVNEFWITAIDVNVSMPLFHTVDEFGIAGVISANLSLGQPVKGTCKVKAEIRLPMAEQDPDIPYYPITLEKETRYFPGVTDFMFTMPELQKAINDTIPDMPANRPFLHQWLEQKEIYVEALVYDWFLRQHATGSSITVIYGKDVELVLLGDRSRTFKPNRIMDIYFAVVHQDGTPLHYFRRQVTISLSVTKLTGSTRVEETKLITGDDGIIHFSWLPEEDDYFAIITGYYDTVSTRSVDLRAVRCYSPTDSYIYITTSTEDPLVDTYMVFTVTTNTFVESIFFLVTSSGNIVTGGELEMFSRQKTFSVSVSRDMIPEAHIVVWHIYKGEVIVDSLNFFVNGTRINNVDIAFNRGKDFTGDTVEVTGRTDPSSFIGASVLDYELYTYGWNTFITEVDIINELRSFDDHVNRSFEHSWKLPNEQEELIHYAAPSYGVDANTTFEYAGLVIFTDSNITRVPHVCNASLGQYPCMDGDCYEIAQRCDGIWQCTFGQDEMGCPKQEIDRYTPPNRRLSLLTRHYVMVGEWSWGGHFVMPNGRLDLTVNVPDEPMTWILGGFAISKDLGFGIIHNPVRHQATRPFYMRAEAPSDVKKGEQIGIRLGLFNYFQQDLEVIVMLHDSEDYKFVVVEEFGIVSSYSPRTIRGNIQSMLFMEKGNVYEFQFPILPIKDGCFDVTVSAYALLYTDLETLTLCTSYDGVTNYLHTPYFVDLISSGSMVLPDLDIPVEERFFLPEERHHLFVPGSPVAKVGIVGDVVGPGFFEEYLNAENTLHMPYGGAEQNMYNFAYTLYNLLYLKETDQLRDEIQYAALEHLNTALQRQLSYMNEDGSFSMFRDYQEHTPSVWVTAFSLRTLHDANQKDWETEYFFMPTELLNKITLWLCTQQQPDGSFVENSPIYDRKMRPNITEEAGGNITESSISLTAYVLITFAETSGLTGNAELCKEAVKGDALAYLERFVQVVDDVYMMAILTYALELSGSDQWVNAFNRLNSMKRTNNYVYWADKDVPANEVDFIDTQPFHLPRRVYDNEAYAVEATSYAMMVYLRRNDTQAAPIMQWLQSMRNTYAGQASTQDTVTALRALTEYAKSDTNRAIYNIEFTVQATSMGNFTDIVHIKKGNWADQQYVNIHPVFGSVRGDVRGTGIALMQLGTWVNVEYPEQILPKPEGHFFDITLVDQYSGRNFSIMHTTVCAKWARPDISVHTGMTVMEIYVPTGYIITNDVLRSYAQSGTVPTLRRAEAYGRKVIFYFDTMNYTDWTCVEYRMDRWFPVANMTIQHLVKVYDYYEPGMHNTTLYTTQDLANLHLCQVCGSFQCPYCPFYNTASNYNIALYYVLLCSAVVSLFLNRRFLGFST